MRIFISARRAHASLLILALLLVSCATVDTLDTYGISGLSPEEMRAAEFDKGLQASNREDYAVALRAWLPLAEQGDPVARYNLGTMYYEGHGVPHDYRQSALWYRLAAEQGYPNAQLISGTGTSTDEAFARITLKPLAGREGFP